MATSRQRLFAIEAGGLCQAGGLQLSLDPFSEACRLLELEDLVIDKDDLLDDNDEEEEAQTMTASATCWAKWKLPHA